MIDWYLFAVVMLMLFLIGFLVQVTILYCIKNVLPKKEGEFFWIYHLRPYRLHADLNKSQYKGLEARVGYNKYRFMADYPTVDDECIQYIARKLDMMCKKKTKQFRQGFLLAFVQQNVKYTYDKNQYGVSEYWALPIQTLSSRKGDCEDTAILYCALAYNMHIDSQLVTVPGHAFPVVRYGLFTDFIIDGEIWHPAETTTFLPIIGLYDGKKDIQQHAAPQIPSAEFREILCPKQ